MIDHGDRPGYPESVDDLGNFSGAASAAEYIQNLCETYHIGKDFILSHLRVGEMTYDATLIFAADMLRVPLEIYQLKHEGEITGVVEEMGSELEFMYDSSLATAAGVPYGVNDPNSNICRLMKTYGVNDVIYTTNVAKVSTNQCSRHGCMLFYGVCYVCYEYRWESDMHFYCRQSHLNKRWKEIIVHSKISYIPSVHSQWNRVDGIIHLD